MKVSQVSMLALALGAALGCQPIRAEAAGMGKVGMGKVGTKPGNVGRGTPLIATANNQLAAFSAGCFWGVEDVFRHVPGVVATAVGYTGGTTTNPTYQQVCTHTTGHAETVLIEFDPARVTYQQLLKVFWENHDPTTPNRQGPDFGSNYRSAIWVYNEAQAQAAVQSRAQAQKKFSQSIVTEIKQAEPFWIAEDYHQQYHEKTGTAACPTGRGN